MKDVKNLIFLFAVVNFIGFLYGVYYYSDVLEKWEPIFWILIIDCPLQALLVGLIFLDLSIENNLNTFKNLRNFAAVGSIKYGLWTMFVILFYYEFFLGSDFITYSILFLAHLGLFLEGFLLIGKKMEGSELILILVFYLLNDAADYLIGTHPVMPHEKIEVIAFITIALTLIVSFIVWKTGNEKGIVHKINEKWVKSEFISKFLSLLKYK
ncbi:MAG: DUF1405 domain-containing protein [Candidatus Micrarchaeota archaeon]|nr:DUF1405 domain-containing protein [Candidatus Micrarchaeota archaeon]